MNNKKVNCFKCEYYYVTWDPNFPRGCRAFAFKTARIPSAQVYQASGEHCLRFKKRERTI